MASPGAVEPGQRLVFRPVSKLWQNKLYPEWCTPGDVVVFVKEDQESRCPCCVRFPVERTPNECWIPWEDLKLQGLELFEEEPLPRLVPGDLKPGQRVVFRPVSKLWRSRLYPEWCKPGAVVTFVSEDRNKLNSCPCCVRFPVKRKLNEWWVPWEDLSLQGLDRAGEDTALPRPPGRPAPAAAAPAGGAHAAEEGRAARTAEEGWPAQAERRAEEQRLSLSAPEHALQKLAEPAAAAAAAQRAEEGRSAAGARVVKLSGEPVPCSLDGLSNVGALRAAVACELRFPADVCRLLDGEGRLLDDTSSVWEAGRHGDITVIVDAEKKELQEAATVAKDLVEAHRRAMEEHATSCRGRSRVYGGRLKKVVEARCTSPVDNPFGPCEACRRGDQYFDPECSVCQDMNKKAQTLDDKLRRAQRRAAHTYR